MPFSTRTPWAGCAVARAAALALGVLCLLGEASRAAAAQFGRQRAKVAGGHRTGHGKSRGWSVAARPGWLKRRPTRVAAIAAVAALAFAAQPASAQNAYITNQSSNTVSVLVPGSSSVATTIPVGNQPYGVAVSPDNSTVYVGNLADGTVSVIATSSSTVAATIPVGSDPTGVAVSPDGSTVYVANQGDNTVSVIATASNSVTATIGVGSYPFGVAVTPDGSTVYVANSNGSGSVSVIATASNTVETTIAGGIGLIGVAVSPDGSTVYVANNDSNTVKVIATATNKLEATISVGSHPVALGMFIRPPPAPPPAVTLISPASGPAGGGTSVTITGTSFTGTTAVAFGGTPALFEVNSYTSITAIAPAGSGTVDVTVTTPAGTSATSAADQFTYIAVLTLTSTASSATQVGQSYSQTNVASGGTPSYTYAVSAGELPAGTALDTSGGTVSGTPTTAGAFGYSITATDSGSPAQTATQTVSGTIAPATLTLTATASSTTQVGQFYRQTNVAGGGSSPYTYSLSASSLPPGTTLNTSNGTVFGTPTTAGAFSYTIEATDSGNPTPQTATQVVSGTIASATLTLSATASATTQVGQNYSQSNVAGGGTTPYTYSLFAGTLPAGTILNSSTGTVSGTPTTAGAFSYTIKVTDSSSPTPQTATQTASGTIAPTTLTLTATASATSEVGQAYSQTNAASGGTTPYTYSVSAGSVPAGTSLNTSIGTVSGTPTTAGAFSYAIKVTDSGNPAQTATQTTSGTIAAAVPTVTAVSPNGGPPAGGTAVRITGTNFTGASAVSFGGTAAARFAVNSTTSITAIAPAGSVGTVDVTVTTGNGTSAPSAADHFSYASPRMTQQGPKLVGSHAAGAAEQGSSVSLSADGNTAIIGGPADNSGAGAAWIFSRLSELAVVPSAVTAAPSSVGPAVWTQTGAKLVGTGANGAAQQGYAVALSGDGNTAIVGGYKDNSGVGAVWIFTRTNGMVATASAANAGSVPAALPPPSKWSQQGGKLVAGDEAGAGMFGVSVALSTDGNTAIVGGYADSSGAGAAWIFTRSNGVWTQQGSKLVGLGAVGNAFQGIVVALSGDGNTALVGGYGDNADNGAAWVFVRSGTTWSQQGSKLLGSGNVGAAEQGYAVALSSDGNTALVGGVADNSDTGAGWIFSRSGGLWTQVGSKLIGTGAIGAAWQGFSVALSGDASTAAMAGYEDNAFNGAAWVFTQSGGVWTQFGSKLFGSGAVGPAEQGSALALSANGTTLIEGGAFDDASAGAAWVFVANGSAAFTATPNAGQGPLAVTFNASGLTPPMTYTVAFGDGTVGALSQSACIATSAAGGAGGMQCAGSASHTYTGAGTDTATLLNASGIAVGTATITVGNNGVVQPLVSSTLH